MPRIYLPSPSLENNRIVIAGEKARYLASVLRCRKGDSLIIFDGKGNCFRTMIITADKREVVAEVAEKVPCNLESDLNITLVQGLLKGEKMDMVVQKTTELGVKEIIPVVTGRSQLRDTKKITRWQKIAEEASRQSGRSIVPVIHETVGFNSFLSVNDSIHGIIFYEEGVTGLTEAVSSLIPHHSSFYVFIGPEGGFTKEEITLAKEKGLVIASLGKRILRAETAAISAVTLMQFFSGDMG